MCSLSNLESLPKLLRKLYEENSRYEIGPPVKLLRELEQNVLVIADMEISDEDIPVICRFLGHKSVVSQITKVEVNRSSGGKVNKRRTISALNSNNFKLFRELIRFIENSHYIVSITFDSIDIPKEMLPYLGSALVSASSELKWLSFSKCTMNGDNGLKILTPYLSQLHVQVLGLEYCELTDVSLPFISSIIRSQINQLDSLYWNASLRVDPTDNDRSELDRIYEHGLVLLSLQGNHIVGNDIQILTKVLKKNYWLLGLNLSYNQIERNNMATLINSLCSNTTIQAVLLRNNPGLQEFAVKVLHHHLRKNHRSNSNNNNSINNNINGVNESNNSNINDSGNDRSFLTSSEYTGGNDNNNNDNAPLNGLALAQGLQRIQLLPSMIHQLLLHWIELQTLEKNHVNVYLQSLHTPNTPSHQVKRKESLQFHINKKKNDQYEENSCTVHAFALKCKQDELKQKLALTHYHHQYNSNGHRTPNGNNPLNQYQNGFHSNENGHNNSILTNGYQQQHHQNDDFILSQQHLNSILSNNNDNGATYNNNNNINKSSNNVKNIIDRYSDIFAKKYKDDDDDEYDNSDDNHNNNDDSDDGESNHDFDDLADFYSSREDFLNATANSAKKEIPIGLQQRDEEIKISSVTKQQQQQQQQQQHHKASPGRKKKPLPLDLGHDDKDNDENLISSTAATLKFDYKNQNVLNSDQNSVTANSQDGSMNHASNNIHNILGANYSENKKDVLENNIPTISPTHNQNNNDNIKSYSNDSGEHHNKHHHQDSYYIGKNQQISPMNDSNNNDNNNNHFQDWPSNHNDGDGANIDGRPPSRNSIRPRHNYLESSGEIKQQQQQQSSNNHQQLPPKGKKKKTKKTAGSNKQYQPHYMKPKSSLWTSNNNAHQPQPSTQNSNSNRKPLSSHHQQQQQITREDRIITTITAHLPSSQHKLFVQSLLDQYDNNHNTEEEEIDPVSGLPIHRRVVIKRHDSPTLRRGKDHFPPTSASRSGNNSNKKTHSNNHNVSHSHEKVYDHWKHIKGSVFGPPPTVVAVRQSQQKQQSQQQSQQQQEKQSHMSKVSSSSTSKRQKKTLVSSKKSTKKSNVTKEESGYNSNPETTTGRDRTLLLSSDNNNRHSMVRRSMSDICGSNAVKSKLRNNNGNSNKLYASLDLATSNKSNNNNNNLNKAQYRQQLLTEFQELSELKHNVLNVTKFLAEATNKLNALTESFHEGVSILTKSHNTSHNLSHNSSNVDNTRRQVDHSLTNSSPNKSNSHLFSLTPSTAHSLSFNKSTINTTSHNSGNNNSGVRKKPQQQLSRLQQQIHHNDNSYNDNNDDDDNEEGAFTEMIRDRLKIKIESLLKKEFKQSRNNNNNNDDEDNDDNSSSGSNSEDNFKDITKANDH